ncbi:MULTISPECIES: GNAT family N-acetyltransferase [Sporosarcina]|uniref:GNAT family N-acetyltransferase n=1 Tax=Sporosarcina TaxID=1569 RepID=UPI000AF4A0C8|nr:MULTISPECIES: GNAT family N-acetyltransferase [Sporosarcina]WJY28630.1 GNAT family N-acetyltransferase [Sporosarcina sp. 0.2-SM1T-5]
MKQLQEILARYETEEDLELFLVKQQEDFIGIVGAEIEEDTMTVHHLSLNPSFRGEGIGKEVMAKLQEEYPDKIPYGNDYTDAFVNKCMLEEARADR